MPEPALIVIELVKTAALNRLLGRPQRWRWTARNGDNHRVLAVSSENYTNRQDCIDAITQLFGTNTNAWLHEPEHGNQLLRLTQDAVE
jgi:uncharacterized protein YegP (UPF0339 family)